MKYPPKLSKDQIAYRASIELPENSYVNLGIGLPSLCAKYLENKRNITFHAENGILGFNEISDKRGSNIRQEMKSYINRDTIIKNAN